MTLACPRVCRRATEERWPDVRSGLSDTAAFDSGHHLLPDRRHTVLIAAYAAEGTRARAN